MPTPSTTTVEVFVDPGCPFAWQTTRWLREVEQHRPVDLRWSLMSLAILNEGQELPAEWATAMYQGVRRLRVLTAAQRDHGDDVVAPLYEAMGRRIHPGGRGEDGDELIAESLAEAGLPAHLLGAADDESLDGIVGEAHERAMAAYGEPMGTPLIAIDGVAYFGPVITRVPRGEAAVAAWDASLVLASTPGFYEIKRRRDFDLAFD